ncbi:MAG: sodium-dependent transporter [Nitrospirota bacterium]|nr:sodium-dependent transporter [Nitrospirota bacterium]
MTARQQREVWATKVGLVLALAGNAVGLGNLLRFPRQVAENGGGAFMVPYFISLILMGIPLMWVELAMGRRGGVYGYGTTPGMFGLLWRHPAARYVGALGILITSALVIYYTYIVSWCMGYAFFSAAGTYFGETSQTAMGSFFDGYLGVEKNQYFSGIGAAYFFFVATLLLVVWILSRGVVKGLETLARIAMPVLFVLGVALVARVLTLEPNPANPGWNVGAGLGFIWNPDLSRLGDGKVWLAAAGQIFFTLSLGFGAIQTYASYIREKQDLALTGLAAASVNEGVEVIIGGTLAIPAAVVFFGPMQTQAIASGGSFSLGFLSLPVVFQQMPFGQFFGSMWFLLLFLAGVTSSVAMAQPAMAFLQEDFRLTRPRAALVVGAVMLVLIQPVIFFQRYGFLDEMDYWVGTFGLVVMALIEVILFAWVFGMDRAWGEITRGAELAIPRVFYYVIKYVTPLFLVVILVVWTWQEAIGMLLMRGVVPEAVPYRWGARLLILGLFAAILFGVHKRWGGKPMDEMEHPS